MVPLCLHDQLHSRILRRTQLSRMRLAPESCEVVQYSVDSPLIIKGCEVAIGWAAQLSSESNILSKLTEAALGVPGVDRIPLPLRPQALGRSACIAGECTNSYVRSSPFLNRNRKIMKTSAICILYGFVALALTGPSLAETRSSKSYDPVPLELVSRSLRRSRITLSPDGRWAALLQAGGEATPWKAGAYSESGVPRVGGLKTELWVTDTRTLQSKSLMSPASWTWAPVWSPDSKQLAFYSDQGGAAALWIWNSQTQKASRYPGIIVRPVSRQDGVEWSADSKRVLLKVLPKDLTIEKANSLGTWIARKAKPLFPTAAPNQPSVLKLTTRQDPRSADPKANPSSRVDSLEDVQTSIADLVILDLTTGQTTPIDLGGQVRWYSLSPDNRYVAFSTYKSRDAGSLQGTFDLFVYDIGNKTRLQLGENLRLSYFGDGCAWSPNSSDLACFLAGTSNREDKRIEVQIAVASVSDKNIRHLRNDLCDYGYMCGVRAAPLWDTSGQGLYVLRSGDGSTVDPGVNLPNENKVWHIDIQTGKTKEVGWIPHHQIRDIVGPANSSKVWDSEHEKAIRVVAVENIAHGNRAQGSGIFELNLETNKSRQLLNANVDWEWDSEGGPIHDVNSLTGDIAYTASDLNTPPEAWIFNVNTRRTKKLTSLNSEWSKYDVGTGQMLSYLDAEGKQLHGGLLLPSGYVKGTRVPLIVYAFGWPADSDRIGVFGVGHLPVFNMFALSTRGYAVFAPDMILRPATRMRDVLNSVIPGLNRAIELGYVDPDRVGILGQSVGSYTTLALITQSSRFKAAAIGGVNVYPDFFGGYLITGVDDLLYDSERVLPTPYETTEGNIGVGGNPWAYRERYIENSPAVLFDKITTPLLIAQGTEDGLLTSNVIFLALKRLNKEAEYLVYEKEGHDLSKVPDIIDFWERRIDFFDKHLHVSRDAQGHMLLDGDR